MRIRVFYETRLSFSAPARAMHLHLRMTPHSFDAQYVSRWRVETNLNAALRWREDSFGSVVLALNWHGPFDNVTVTAAGEVETFDKVGVVHGVVETLPAEMYLRAGSLALANAALRDFAKAVGGDDPLDRLHRLMDAVHERLTFKPGLGGEAPAAEVFAMASGGAADFAHVFVAAARALDIPARVVTGYRLDETADAAAQMSAWAEALTPGLGWIAFDAVSNQCADDSYIRVAAGFDARDAMPVRCWTNAGDAVAIARLVVEQAAKQSQN